MLNKFVLCFSAGLLLTMGLTGCATKTDESADGGAAIVEDPSIVENGDSLENGAIVVGDDYASPNDGLDLTKEQRAQLQALKQDNIIYFAFDSEAIPTSYVSLLEAHADFLRGASKVTIIIEGHTDERGTPEYNIALGERRARAVAQYLLNLGVPAQQISIVSYGEEKPQIFEHNENAWKKNRRAVISY